MTTVSRHKKDFWKVKYICRYTCSASISQLNSDFYTSGAMSASPIFSKNPTKLVWPESPNLNIWSSSVSDWVPHPPSPLSDVGSRCLPLGGSPWNWLSQNSFLRLTLPFGKFPSSNPSALLLGYKAPLSLVIFRVEPNPSPLAKVTVVIKSWIETSFYKCHK